MENKFLNQIRKKQSEPSKTKYKNPNLCDCSSQTNFDSIDDNKEKLKIVIRFGDQFIRNFIDEIDSFKTKMNQEI